MEKAHVLVITDGNLRQEVFIYRNKGEANTHARTIMEHRPGLSALVFEDIPVGRGIPLERLPLPLV